MTCKECQRIEDCCDFYGNTQYYDAEWDHFTERHVERRCEGFCMKEGDSDG